MAYVPVPKDLSNVKTKVVFNLTKRQLICFSIALIVGLPLFFLLKDKIGTSVASLVMIFSMLPFFMFAMYEKHGQPLEIILKNYIGVRFLNPKQRPYKTNNFYAVIMRQEKLDKEVKHIVTGKQSNSHKAYKSR
jgi:cytosine/uracil/thiamine/allantoin permease